MIDPRLLRYFVVVAEELHFGHAAWRLHIKQPPLSQAIQKLERDLGVQLLRRSRRQVELTEAGEILLQSARQILAQHEQFAVTAERVRTGEIGTLRIGYTQSMPFLSEFMNALQRMRAELPDVSFELKNVSTRSAFQSLIGSHLDIALVRSVAPVPKGLESLVVGHDRLMLVLPKTHRLAGRKSIALRELAEESFIQQSRQLRTEYHEFLQRAWIREARDPLNVIEAGDASAVVALVAAGFGVSILPSTLQAITIADLIWRAIDATTDEELTSTILAVHRSNPGTNPALQKFIELLASQAERSAG
jgi:DNA-binding transcriptional LysR family regulator